MKTWTLAVMASVVLLLVGSAHAAVPEIDGGSAVSALGVLIGVITLAAERLRRR